MDRFIHKTYREEYLKDDDFKDVFQQLQIQSQVHDHDNTIDYHLRDTLLQRMEKLRFPKGEQEYIIIEEHTSKVVGYYGVRKTMMNLKRYAYWPKMQGYVAWFIGECMLCCTNKPSKMKQSLYHALPIPTHYSKIIYMEILRGLQIARKGHV